ncbi:hypothetical protein H6G76_28785 [Nostoc sp. FACHB-152]|uniref:hypothetical protein n=1 Tax=unclassified Nostoc TaxID=2593658 RepID=UPI001686D777|nr:MULTISPECIES: hypothetical protein [unclassified Nostoc]MBD2451055.1 hypothetical protein [Nostoc sp. FACHB-152]MBD2471093.1 hypothetical protein [Nostoc sp. FACHB-145]
MVVILSQEGKAIDQHYDYLHDAGGEWDTWITGNLPQELLFCAKKWYNEFKFKTYPTVGNEIEVYLLRFWNENSLVEISVNSPKYWIRQGASELHNFSVIWNTLKKQGGNDDELAAIHFKI